jgi:hypothetical protein
MSVAGCIPANYIKRAQAAKPCDVTVCANIWTGLERCDCIQHRDVQRQLQLLTGSTPL